MRYLLELSYNGTNYHGWQVQDNAHTVQQEINDKLATILRQPIDTLGCGRTDTGVHATQFFAQFDYDGEIPEKIVYRLNGMLPADIAIANVKPVHDEFNVRFDAEYREYEYHIHFSKNPFLQDRSYFLNKQPDVELMNKAAKVLFDYEDFECFSKTNTQVYTYLCTMMKAEWEQSESKLIFTIRANRFLRNMVRAIVGTLLDVGFGKMTVEEFKAVIESKKRSNAGLSVPACGLYLTKVSYPINEQ